MAKGVNPVIASILLVGIASGLSVTAYYGITKLTEESRILSEKEIERYFGIFGVNLIPDVIGNCEVYLRNIGEKDVPMEVIEFYVAEVGSNEFREINFTTPTKILKRDDVARINFKLQPKEYKLVVRIYDVIKDIGFLTCALSPHLLDINEGLKEIFKGGEILVKFESAPEPSPNLVHLYGNLYKVKFSENTNIGDMIKLFEGGPNVEYAEPNYIMKLALVPNDPYFSSSGSFGQSYYDMWNLYKMDMDEAWDIERGNRSIIIAVIDTGLDYNHEDFSKENLWENEDEIPNNGIDDDNNGFVDDIHGWNFASNNNNLSDCVGHGTHVAGTIAAATNNSIGIAGIVWNVSIMPVKLAECSHMFSVDVVIQAIKYAIDNGADVLSMSIGGWGSPKAEEEIINYAYKKGITCVAAAGNANDYSRNYAPARFLNVITVAASTPEDEKAFFSNWGNIDVAAPGLQILSLRATGTACNERIIDNILVSYPTYGGYYCVNSGTSMAAPHVSALVALLLSKNSTLSNEEIRSILRTSTDDLNASGYDIYTGYGRINASRALKQPIPPIAHISMLDYTYVEKGKAAITLEGTAKGKNFERFDISYGYGLVPAVWNITYNSTTPVEEKIILKEKEFNFLREGYWTFNLTVVETTGETATDLVSIYYTPYFIFEFGEMGTEEGKLFGPYTIAVDRENNLYIGSAMNGLQKFNEKGKFISRFSSTSNFGYVTINGNDIWYVDNVNWKVLKFNSTGEKLKEIDINYKGILYGIAVDNNYIYLTTREYYELTGDIKKYDIEGNLISNFGELKEPYDIAIYKDSIYVTDSMSHEILKFNKTTENLISTWGGLGSEEGKFNNPTGISIDKNGNVYVLDTCNHRIQVFDENGNYIKSFGVKGTEKGQFGFCNISLFNFHGDITIDEKGHIYVTDFYGHRIQKFCVNGITSEADHCNDGYDNDCDGLIDCEDIDDCPPTLPVCNYCTENESNYCTDEIDNDCDTKIDCEDEDCFGNTVCIPNCSSKLIGDVNSDGKITKNDAYIHMSSYIGHPSFPEPTDKCCMDVDDDGNITLKDALIIAQFVEGIRKCFDRGWRCDKREDCTNNIDDDCDRKVDCGDDDCLSEPVCQYVCVDGSLAGDVNNDHIITSYDAFIVSQIVVGNLPYPNNICCGDVDGDGNLTIEDSVHILEASVGSRTYFEIGCNVICT